MATEFSREFFADNRIVKASLRCAHKLREKDLDRIKSEIKDSMDSYLWKKIQRSPVILPVIMEV